MLLYHLLEKVLDALLLGLVQNYLAIQILLQNLILQLFNEPFVSFKFDLIMFLIFLAHKWTLSQFILAAVKVFPIEKLRIAYFVLDDLSELGGDWRIDVAYLARILYRFRLVSALLGFLIKKIVKPTITY